MEWNLTYLFKTNEDFESSLRECSEILKKLESYEGLLKEETKLVEFLLLEKEFEEKLSKTYQYASLKSDLDKKNVEDAARLSNVEGLLYLSSSATSFSNPEMLALGKEYLIQVINKHPEIEEFRFGIEKLFHQQEHVLDGKSEKLLSFYAPVEEEGSNLYSQLAVADNVDSEVVLSNGNKVLVTMGNYTSLIGDADNEEDRRIIFEAIFNKYALNKNTYGEIYKLVLNTNKANAQARNFPTILESFLFGNNIPTSVFLNLIDVASHKNASLKKYIQLRAKALGIKEYHTYDRHIELAKSNKKYTYEEAKALFFASIKDLPADFKSKAKEVLEPGFVDVFEHPGKRSGAYSSGMPNLHPFILLNFDSSLDAVFTLAHESGHSIHSLYAKEAQPSTLQNYTIFVAEIASTFNEHNLLDYFLSSSDTTLDEKIMVVQKAIDEIVGTFYRQTLFAEYEYKAHKLVEENKPVNYQALSDIMIDLYKEYYGLDITKEKVKEFVWAYIPHLFYTPFYVYQYATSFAASFKLYDNYKKEGNVAFDRYVNLLKSGGSKYPMEQVKEAGVDFTKTDAFMAVVDRMDYLVEELEKLLKQKHNW